MRSPWYLSCITTCPEENPYLRGLDVTIPPDLLREHLATLARHGDLVSVAEGLQRLTGEAFDGRRSASGDDGFVGVRGMPRPCWPSRGIRERCRSAAGS